MGTTSIVSNSKILNRINFTEIEDELTLFLRNNLIDRRNRTSNNTENFTISDNNVFELADDLDSKNRHMLKNIKYLTIDGIEQTLYNDYIAGFKLRTRDLISTNPDIGKIRFWNIPTGTDMIVNYDYAKSFVYPQHNRVDLSKIQYPRVSIDVSGETEDLGIGAGSTVYNMEVNIVVTDALLEGVRSLIQQITNLFANEYTKKGFHNFTYILVESISDGPTPNTEDTNDVVWEQTITLSIPNQFQFGKTC